MFFSLLFEVLSNVQNTIWTLLKKKNPQKFAYCNKMYYLCTAFKPRWWNR